MQIIIVDCKLSGISRRFIGCVGVRVGEKIKALGYDNWQLIRFYYEGHSTIYVLDSELKNV